MNVKVTTLDSLQQSLWTKVGRRTASTGCWWSSEQSTGVWTAADAVRIQMITSTQLSRCCCCWVRNTNHRATEQSEKFHVRRGDPSIICFADYSQSSSATRKGALTEAHSKHELFSVCSLRDNNAIISKPTWKSKHANSILEPSEYFYQISSKSIHTISSYTVAKLGRFLRHSVDSG